MTKDTINQARKREVEALLADLEKQFGKGTARPVSQKPTIQLERISTGSVAIDYATGGGVPRGRVTELYGVPSGGKTSLALRVMAQAQQVGLLAAMIDAEQTFDEVWARKMGVDTDAMLLHQPQGAEEALEVALRLTEVCGIVVVDSVAALVPDAEVKGEMGEVHMGLRARLLGQAMRKMTPKAAERNCALLFINQVRDKLGEVYGNPETTPGGHALKFHASLRLAVRLGEPIKKGNNRIGDTIRVRVTKNKTAQPFRTAETRLLYGIGFDLLQEYVDVGVSVGVFKRAGAHYSYADQKLGQGKDAVLEYVRSLDDVSLRNLHHVITERMHTNPEDPEVE